jgi:hypothetical protein
MEETVCSKTSAYKIQTPGNHPEVRIQHSEHGESLKSRIIYMFVTKEIWKGKRVGWMDCSLCDNAIPPPEIIPYSYNGEGAIMTGLIGTF